MNRTTDERQNITLATLAASLLIGTTAGGAFAQDRGDRRGPPRGGPEVMFVRMLQQFDTNKDGKIEKAEATAASEALFTQIDADNDGSITRARCASIARPCGPKCRRPVPR